MRSKWRSEKQSRWTGRVICDGSQPRKSVITIITTIRITAYNNNIIILIIIVAITMAKVGIAFIVQTTSCKNVD